MQYVVEKLPFCCVMWSKRHFFSPDLRLEMLHLTEERNSLSQQLANDAAEFEKTIKSMKKAEENHKEINRSLEKQSIEYEEVST